MLMKTTYPIRYGDRIFVRAMQEGRTVLEMTVTNVRDITGLVGEIRYAGRRLDGLTSLFIRNLSRGWSMERPFRFYTGIPSPGRVARRDAIKSVYASYGRMAVGAEYPATPAPRRRVAFPWDTH